MPNAVIVGSALAAVVAAGAIAVLRRFAPLLPADVPNPRSLHVLPVPRAGGYAIWAGFLPAALLFPPPFPGGLAGWMPAWAALFAVSAQDDRGGVGVGTRFAVHAGAAAWTAAWLVHGTAFGAGAAMTMLYVAGCTLALAWSANLFNFMDGSDGLAAAMGIIGFGAYGLAAILGGPATGADARASAGGAAPALLALAAAIVPFLAVNRPRASMFLGDAGAVPMGFLAAAFGIDGVASGWWPSWFPPLVFLPFVADATLTLVRRIGRGERPWEAHRSHYYQRLHRLGAGHAGTLAAYAAAMLGTAASALACLAFAPAAGPWALALSCVVVIMLFAAIDYHWRKHAIPPAPR
ncbi:MAG: MraY family glycosyltransferase [Casimicrobiaceae bacterium]